MPPSSSTKHNLLLILFIIGLFLQIGWYCLLFSQAIHQQAYLRKLDFISFYTAGRLARAGDWTGVYDMQAELDLQRSIAGRTLPLSDFLPYNHPPLLLPLQALMAVENYVQAYLLWIVIRSLILLIAACWIFRMVRRLGWDRLSAFFFGLECVLFYPVFVGLIKGQDTSLALLGMVICLSGLVRADDVESGLGLALTVIRPQLILPLSLPFIFKRRRIWWWFLAGAAVLGILSVLMVGRQGVKDFLSLLAASANGEMVAIHSYDMYNLMGMLIRLFPELDMNTITTISWAVYLLTIVLFCVWWARSKDITPAQFGIATVLVLFVSPHLHDHDLALLLVPIVALCLELVKQKRLSFVASSLLILGITIYMVVIQLTGIKFMGIYTLMFFIVSGLYYLGKRTPALQPMTETR
jgi:Glycosyltransferase family 87